MVKIAVFIEGGLVQGAVANQEDIQLLVVDRDIDGAIPDDLQLIEGSKVYAHQEDLEINSKRIETVFDEYKQNIPVKEN